MRLFKLAIIVAAGALLTGSTMAQRPGGGGGFGGGFGRPGMAGGMAFMLSFNKQLQDELKMDKEQVEKLSDAMTKAREGLGDLFAKLRDASQEERAEIMKKMADENTKAVNSVLKPEQQKRLHQIENQQAGVGMYTKEDVQKSLKLTDEQKSKIETINADLQKELRELRGGGRGGFDPDTQRKRQALTKEAVESVAGVLTDEQKAQVKELTGAPFELRMEGFGFGGGAGGPGGPGGGFGGGGFGGGFGGPAQPGQVLSTAVQDRLKLSDDQKKQMQELQKDVDAKLEKILTEEQRKQLKDMGQPRRGRGGPGGQP